MVDTSSSAHQLGPVCAVAAAEVRALRTSAGYSLVEASIVTGLTTTEIADAESGRRDPRSVLLRLRSRLASRR